MYGVLLGLHVLVCLGLIGVVLIQSGKGGGLAGGAFGQASQSVFGGRGANDFITRATIGLGVTFFATSVALALLTSHSSTATDSVMHRKAAEAAARAQQSQQGRAPVRQGSQAPPTQGGAPATGAPAGQPSGK